MFWHEDFGDEPSIEERMPIGVSPEEKLAVSEQIWEDSHCSICEQEFAESELIETGMYEYCTMDLDPGTKLCPECLEAHRDQYIPDDPMLFDCYTPIQCI